MDEFVFVDNMWDDGWLANVDAHVVGMEKQHFDFFRIHCEVIVRHPNVAVACKQVFVFHDMYGLCYQCPLGSIGWIEIGGVLFKLGFHGTVAEIQHHDVEKVIIGDFAVMQMFRIVATAHNN